MEEVARSRHTQCSGPAIAKREIVLTLARGHSLRIGHLPRMHPRRSTDPYAAVFTEDADYIGFDRMHFKGHREIAENPAAL